MFEILVVSVQWIMVLLAGALVYYAITRFILKYHSLNPYQKRHVVNGANGAEHNISLSISSEGTEGLASNRIKSYRQKLLGFIPWRTGLEIYGVDAQSRLQSHGWEK